MPLRYFAYRRGHGSFASGLSKKSLCGPLYGGQRENLKVLKSLHCQHGRHHDTPHRDFLSRAAFLSSKAEPPTLLSEKGTT